MDGSRSFRPHCDAALRQRGSLTVWFTDEAIERWRAEPRTTPGGQPAYSSLAILTALTLKAVFRLALRQTEGLIGFIIGLLGLAVKQPGNGPLYRRPIGALTHFWCMQQNSDSHKALISMRTSGLRVQTTEVHPIFD